MAGDTGTDEVLATVRASEIDVRYRDHERGERSQFEHQMALAVLLIHDVVDSNNQLGRDDLPEKERHQSILLVDCSDVFAWGSSDAERLPFTEIERVYRMWRRDPVWGSSAWAVMSRGQEPQERAADAMAAIGWDVGRLSEGGQAARDYVDEVLSSPDWPTAGPKP